MKVLGKGSVASIIKVALHVAGIFLWIGMIGLIVGIIGYAVALGLLLSGVIDVNLPGEGAWDYLMWPIVVPALTIGAVAIGGSLLIVRRLRRLFESLTSGEPFRRENAEHLRVIWITMLVMEVARYVFGGAVLALIAAFGAPPDLDTHFEAEAFDFAPWISILVIIVLAEVFREGARLREEQELTI
ncbi:MAG: DUF2975 domain-containing protein [Terricaulis sp.]